MERVVQFETKRKTSPGFDILAFYFNESWEMRKQASTGAAWLSSARAVRCSLKWGNERNPRPMLNIHWGRSQFYWEGRRGRRQVSTALMPWATHTLQWRRTMGLQHREVKPIPEISPQFRLQAAIRLHEVGIGSNRGSACRGECVLGSCTHRPSRQQSP